MDIDIARHIGATSREVRSGTRDGAETRTVVASRKYPTTVEDLWDAVTNPERLPRWFLPVTGDLRPGGRYQFQGNAGGGIERCEPPEHLEVTWEFGGGVSWLTVRLSAEGEGEALLTLEHTAPVDGHWDNFGPGAVGVGWDMALMGLGEHVVTAEPKDPAAAQAWMVSEQGREFVRRSSEGWYRAAVAAGEADEVARRRAEATTTAYTAG